jgi:very-long-chain (3R)-3-hydroxyacyl-CoA dehydratase
LFTNLRWLYIFILVNQSILGYKTKDDLFKAKLIFKNSGLWLKIFQTLALLEVVHAALKLVRSNPFLNFLQIVSRLVVVWGIVNLFPTVSVFRTDNYFIHLKEYLSNLKSKECVGVLMICFAWSITEIVRYSYYALNILDCVPYILTWLRYSLFIVLYPFGVAGELTCIFYGIYHVYPIKNRNRYSLLLPNSFNFSFDILYILLIAVIAYIPGFPVLYKHMLAQRKKILSGSSGEKAKKE